MSLIPMLLASLLLSTPIPTASAASNSEQPALILVSMDGFRYDYLDKYPDESAFLRQLSKRGVFAPVVQSTFTTKTFPTHWTMATGLYQESHGIVSNDMYDPVFNETFSKRTRDTRWWNASLPLWISARRQGRRSATFYWPGSEVEFNGERANFWRDYNQSVPFDERAKTVADWVANQGVKFATMYMHQPDKACHKFGPDSPQVAEGVRQANDGVKKLFDELESAGLADKVNVLIVSDHGGVAVNSSGCAIEFRDVPADLVYLQVDQGPLLTYFAKANKGPELKRWLEEKISSKSFAAKVFTRNSTPTRFRYANNKRIPDVLVLPQSGCLALANKAAWRDAGTHGYDNEDAKMQTPMIGVGPGFRASARVEGFRQIDLYELSCRLMGIKPEPNNGSSVLFGEILNSAGSCRFDFRYNLLVLLLYFYYFYYA